MPKTNSEILSGLKARINEAFRQAAMEMAMEGIEAPSKPARRKKQSGLLPGVTLDKRNGKFGAKLTHEGRFVWLGTYETEQAAAAAFDAAVLMKEAGKTGAEIEMAVNPRRQKRRNGAPRSAKIIVDDRG